jgi:hypothetical protein
MPDQPDETQKQQRRSTALPPFFAPRTTRPTTPSQSGAAAPPRRSSQLFTPPGVQKQRPATPPATPLATPAVTRRATPFAAPAIPAPLAPPPWSEHEQQTTPIAAASPELVPESAPTPQLAPFEMDPPAAQSSTTFDAPPEMPNAERRDDAPQAPAAPRTSDAFVIEQFEQAPISLRATGDHAAVQDDGALSFQVYDDASRLLEHGARPAPAGDDSIEIERTEVTFGPPAADSRLEVESFWAAEAILADDTARDADAAAPLGTAPAAEMPAEMPAAEPPSMDRATQPMMDAIERSHEAMPVPSWLENVPSEPAPVVQPAPELAPVAECMHAPEPTTEPEAASDDDAEEALAEAFSGPAPNETVPRWATPRVNRAVSDDDRPTQPNDGWNLAPPEPPPDELAVALAWPDSGLRAPTPAKGAAAQSNADTSHELAASAEGWPLSVAGRPGVPDAVAAALERIAQRVRAGDVPLPADVALARTDESALALTLAALLRAASATRA